MLYLLRSYGKDENGGLKSILKVGYASNIDDRLSQYTSHNPYIEILSTQEGSLLDEKILHLYLHFLAYQVDEIGREWYKDCQEVIDVFNKGMILIKADVWDNRDDIFNMVCMDFRSINTYEMYESLLSVYGKDLVPVDINKEDGEVLKSNSTKFDKKYFRVLENKNPRDRESIFSKYPALSNIKFPEPDSTFNDEIESYYKLTTFQDKIEYLSNLDPDIYNSIKTSLPISYTYYIDIIGPEKCKALRFEEKAISDYIEDNRLVSKSTEGIINLFEVGKTYTKAEIKEMLKKYYSEAGIKQTPKASDILSYFEISDVMLRDKETGKRIASYKILKRK